MIETTDFGFLSVGDVVWPSIAAELKQNVPMIAWFLVIAATFGHFSLHLAIYNRLNATGLRRVTIKRTEKIFLASCLTIPVILGVVYVRACGLTMPSMDYLAALNPWLQGYGMVCIVSTFVFGIPWLLWRPLLKLEWIDAARAIRIVDVEQATEAPLALSRKCKWQAKIPGNQILQLAIEELELPIAGLPPSLDGLKISHLSDLHFTGDVSPLFAKYVIAESNRWQPDLCVVTGDIIDQQPCIAWLNSVFTDACANSGKYFILGNHDTRVPDPNEIRQAMQRSGWTDLGGRSERLTIGNTSIEIIGNESPWFAAPSIAEAVIGESMPFRILLSHSPDQIWWARKRNVGLMLAGHTHGGQGRLPFAGPMLSPSWHGSRFASGDFYKAPTTLHVSRGLGGVHLLRLNCRPELSLLTLRSV